ncbi:unnamed protein product [Microthlaspi erraticum]|uniref:DUF220 domain-containing protein n=1 Tax=Microthlaspi erraticum TaxID=1685480 RepID=A0A6D2JAK3_9BRAS|nr:unnamed protein product [Microthlaspi erraticum]
MGAFPGFGIWINQNTQQPPKAESKRSENGKSNSEPPKDDFKYYDIAEVKRQIELWMAAEKKHPWYDAPPKVTTKKGLCHMKIELTIGLPPESVFDRFTNPTNLPFFFQIDESDRQLLENKSRKVLKKDGPREIAKTEKAVAVDVLWWSGSIPITLIVYENQKDLTAKYKKERMMFMKVFEGSYKVEPLYVDSKRLCKNIVPKSPKEYKRCSGGQGKIASKVTMDQYFQPDFPLNLPPFSWYIREITINTTKTLLKMLQNSSISNRETESKRSENVKSKSVSDINTNKESEETKKQLKLWRASEKEYSWHDWPAKVKQTKEGETLMTMQFRIGLPPETVFDVLTSHNNQAYLNTIKNRKVLETISKKVISDNGPKEKMVEVEKAATWKFLWWSKSVPVPLVFNERRKDFSAIYETSKEKAMFMKPFGGKWTIEPEYIHNDKYCKPRLPSSMEEYRKCTGGKGLVASKVTLQQFFEPLFPLNLPPVSWYIRSVVVKKTKTIIENL